MKGDLVIPRRLNLEGKCHLLAKGLSDDHNEYFAWDMLGRVMLFYFWAAEHLDDNGSLEGIEYKQIADAAAFYGSEDEITEFVGSLIDVGLLEETDGGLVVHRFREICPRT